MNHLKDLHFKQQILSLFDHVMNEFSRDRLLGLLGELPASVEQIDSRQQMLKALLRHPHLFSSFSYARIELHEVHEATVNNKQRADLLLDNWLMFYLPFPVIKKQQQLGKVILVMSFFKRINSAYFAELQPHTFPAFFKNSLQDIQELFAELEVHSFDMSANKKSLRGRMLVKKMHVIDQHVRTGKMEAFWNSFFLFEAYLSIAKGIRRYGFQFPIFTDAKLKIKDFYYPLVNNAVRNSIEVTSTVHLLTGPNMSGKSTLLRALGLCVYLAHLGLAVPAAACELQFYDVISVAIDLNDDVQSGYSHFMTEIGALKNVVMAAKQGKTCFAVFDELFRGTNSDDALVISLFTIQGLTHFSDSSFFISTHLQALRESLEATHSICLQHIDCQLSNQRPVFTYLLKDGWSEVRIGQTLFEQAGLKELLA